MIAHKFPTYGSITELSLAPALAPEFDSWAARAGFLLTAELNHALWAEVRRFREQRLAIHDDRREGRKTCIAGPVGRVDDMPTG
jgi:hypothetical protein